jgi:formate dehydrogenase maturation protein FdhE
VTGRAPSPDSGRPFEQRAERAELLGSASNAAREPLRFAAGLARTQAEVARAIERAHASRAPSGKLADDLDPLLEHLLAIPRFVAEHGPRELAADAARRATEPGVTAATRLCVYWRGDLSASDDYLSRAMLRPYVECSRAQGVAVDRARARGRCPFCSSPSSVGCRRSAESDGGARFLCCPLCGLEWPFNRILCPSCFEENPQSLPSFASESHANVRLEACETCRRYVKSFDLSQDARPVPEVDDLESIALDLWALERGFTRVEPGLAGI